MKKNLLPITKPLKPNKFLMASTLGLSILAIKATAQDNSFPANLNAPQNDTTKTNDSIQSIESIHSDDVPVEISGIRAKSFAPFAISNLSETELNKYNTGQSLPYLLNQQQSVVTTSDDGVGVGYSSMYIRGTDIARTNMTINGIPVNDPESQAVIFVDFGDLAATSSLQIQRGVGSSTNGAGAFGASLNVYNLAQDSVANFTISNGYGSYNTWRHTLQAGSGNLKGGFNFDVRLSKISSDGYVQRAFTDLTSMQFLAGWQSKDNKTTVKFNMLMGKERTGQAWNGLTAEQIEENRRQNTLGDMGNGQYYNDQTDNYWQNYYQLFADHKINNNWSLHLGAFLTRGYGFYNEYKTKEYYSSYGLPPANYNGTLLDSTDLTRQLWLDNYYYGGVYSLNYHKKGTEINIGGAYSQYDGNHYGYVKWAEYGAIPLDYRWYKLKSHKYDFNIYAKLQQNLSKHFIGFLDMQYRFVKYDLDGFRKNPDIISNNNYNFFNPKAGVTYLNNYWIPKGYFKAFGSFAIANKEPNRDDFEASPLNKPKSEHLNDLEFGAEIKNQKMNFGLNLYYMWYDNQLINTGKINDVGAYARTNVKNSYRAGIELNAAYQFTNWISLSGNVTLSRNKIKDFDEFIDNWDDGSQIKVTHHNTNISFSPNYIASAMVSIQPLRNVLPSFENVYIEPNIKYVSRQYLDNTQNKERSLDPYTLLNISARYTLTQHFFKSLNIIANFNNILGHKYNNNGYGYGYYTGGTLYADNSYFPQATVNYSVGLSVGF